MSLMQIFCRLLLLNPWVRTFLELPPTSKLESDILAKFSAYDPARFLQFISTTNPVQEDNKPAENESSATSSQGKPMDRSESYAALRRMPAYLRTPISDLEELIIRDCISSWYNFHSFGESTVTNQARYSIDYAVGSIYAGLENVRSADMISDVLLTSSSVLLTTLRSRRLHPNRPAVFSSNTARISALREALDRLLVRHLPPQDGSCDLMRTLLREILCKQLWNAICGIGEPDFINRSIVVWGENQKAKETGEPSVWSEEPSSYQESPQPAYRTNSVPEVASPFQGSLLSTPAREFPTMGPRSPAPSKMHTSPAPDTMALTIKAPSTPTNPVPPRLEPLTMQPRAIVMPTPSKLGNNPGTVTSSSTLSSPALSHPPPLPRRPLSANQALNGSSPLTESFDRSTNIPTNLPSLPPRNDKGPADEETVSESAWSLVPMNIPPEANKGMLLPESLQKSLKRSDTPEGYRLSLDDDSIGEMKSPPTGNSSRSYLPETGNNSQISPTKGDERGHASADSQLYQARSRPASRPASSTSGGIPPAPDLIEVLSNTSSPSLSALRDAFEAFLERGGVASRSLFFSPPSAATVAQGEGELLLKLHYGLTTIARLVPNDANEEGEIYREDAFNTVYKSLQGLTDIDDSIAGRALREALLVAAQRLEIVDDGRVREVLRPVESCLWSRLSGLYDHFWKETCTRPAGSRPTVSSPSLSANGRSSFSTNRQSEERNRPSLDQLHYQPRKKLSTQANNTTSAPMSKSNSRDENHTEFTTRPDSTPPAKVPTSHDLREQQDWITEASSSSPTPIAPPPVPPRQEKVTRPIPRRAEVQPLSDDMLNEAPTTMQLPSQSTSLEMTSEEEQQPLIEITATDVSPNSDRPDMLVDTRTYEVMIAVEGLVAGGGGFVLLRTWRDLQQMEERLRITPAFASGLEVLLPSPKSQTSLTLTKEIESYLVKLLSTPTLVETEAVQYFVDKRRAGEPASNRSTILMDSLRLSNKGLGLGKTFANGVGVGAKNALNTLQMMPGNVAALSRPLTKSAGNSPQKGVPAPLVDDIAPIQQNRLIKSEEKEIPRPPLPRPPTSTSPAQQDSNTNSSELSPQELDNLLSCFFAIADEAFNLSGGWTLRRGLLRVLEQVVRTQYWSSIMGIFHNLSHSLNQEQIASWIVQLKDQFWPDEAAVPSDQNKSASAAPNATTFTEIPHPSHPEKNVEESAAELLVEAVEESGPDRSAKAKLACHLQAKNIVISQTPAGSAYFLGPGGKQSCEKALNLLHEEITKPETSLDLVLTIVLKLCNIAAR